ncbi:MAG: hypothetical protein KDC95_05840 [Planctomycetes bacterium]|nr:hypothetical protein [Planctomycetota bacterium]
MELAGIQISSTLETNFGWGIAEFADILRASIRQRRHSRGGMDVLPSFVAACATVPNRRVLFDGTLGKDGLQIRYRY